MQVTITSAEMIIIGTFTLVFPDVLSGIRCVLRRAPTSGLYSKNAKAAFRKLLIKLNGRNAGKSNSATASLG